MHPQIGSSGYYQVVLRKSNKSKTHKVHRIVAETYIPNPGNKRYVDHINTIRTDCRACNLRWVTLVENSNNPITKHHAKYCVEKEFKRRNVKKDVHHNSSKVKARRLYRYALTGEYIDSFPSVINAEQSTGVEMSGIRKALDKSYRTAGGYLWRTDKKTYCEPYKRRRHTKCRSVVMVDTNCVVKGKWDSIRDAAKALGTTHTRIYNHIQAKTPIDGFLFKYSD